MRFLVLSFVLIPTFASAHSWYEPSCCSQIDCYPVEDGTVLEKSDGVHVRGFGIMTLGDPRLRWSHDDQDHICSSRAGKLLCVYRRPKGM